MMTWHTSVFILCIKSFTDHLYRVTDTVH